VEVTKKTARLAGLLYFLASLTAPFGLLYVPGKLFVQDDAAATAERIRTFETLMRWGIAANLLGGILFIFTVLVLYRLFKPVSEKNALAMLVLLLLSFPISFVNVLNELAALNLAKGGALSALAPPERDALSYLFMWLHLRAYVIAQILWGLWLFPFGACVIRSGFIPRILGYLLMIAGAGYPIASFAELVLPQYADAVSKATMILAFGELPIIFWLLIWGAKPQRAAARAA
jgi:hypothetical protein